MLKRMQRIPVIMAMLFVALVSALGGDRFDRYFEGDKDITDY
jgi:hypothetical protein